MNYWFPGKNATNKPQQPAAPNATAPIESPKKGARMLLHIQALPYGGRVNVGLIDADEAPNGVDLIEVEVVGVKHVRAVIEDSPDETVPLKEDKDW